MAKQLQLRRGTTAQHSTFTGAVGEVTVDTDKKVVVVHDGSIAGGVPLSKESTVTSHTSNTSNPHSVTKTQVGLSNVTNDVQVKAVSSTDNAIVRFDGTSGQVQNSGVVIDDSGNVGIGTSSPNSPLDIKASNSVPMLRLTRSESPSQGMTIKAGGGECVFDSVEGTNVVYGAYVFNSTKGSTVAERMRIDSSGNVGIGTSSPSKLLTLANTTSQQLSFVNSNYLGYKWDVGRDNVVTGNFTISNAEGGASTTRMVIDSSGNVGIGISSPYGKLSVMDSNGGLFFDGTGTTYNRFKSHSTTTGTGKDLLIATNSGGDSGIYISSTGYVGIGTTTDNGVDKLQVNGSIRVNGNFNTDGRQLNAYGNQSTYEFVNRGNQAKTFQWYIGASGSAPLATLSTSGVWTNASDIRNKENIKDIHYGLSTVMALSPKEYDLKSDGTHCIGFVAQEVREIVPELVFGDEEKGHLTLDYASITSILVKAVQELSKEIEILKGK